MYVSSVRVLLGGKSFELEAKDGEMLLSALRRAVDLGTTTVAVRLYDLETGIELATDSAWNAQAACGGDVISRIRHTMDVPDGLGDLSRIIRSQVEDMISSALAHCGRANSSLRHSVLVGNTVMQHIFAHFPVQSIAAAPFEPYTLFDDKPDDTLLGAPLYYAPFVAGYVGGDITAGLLSSGLSEKDGRYLFLDIGANRRKLEEHGIFNKTADYNLRLSELSKKAAGGKAWVAGESPLPACSSALWARHRSRSLWIYIQSRRRGSKRPELTCSLSKR